MLIEGEDNCENYKGESSVIEDTIKEYVSRINYQGSNTNKSKLDTIVSYIVSRLLDKSDLNPRVRNLDLLSLIDIDDITLRYIDFYEKIIPLLNKYLDSLDNEAEMTLLFCRNYVLEIVKFSLSDSYKRHIKINEILDDKI
jgi:hypothetical protein